MRLGEWEYLDGRQYCRRGQCRADGGEGAGDSTYFQNMGLNAIDAAATEGVL